MTDAQRQKRVDKAQMRVLFHTPFFAAGVAKLPVLFDDVTPTACTDGQRIKWGRKFFDELPDEQLVTVLCHEVCHCLLGHLWRAPVGCDWTTWNEATDHLVNGMLKEYGAQATANRMADPFPLPDGALADDRFAKLSEEEVYGILMAAKPPGGKGGGPKPGQPRSGTGSQGSGGLTPGQSGVKPSQSHGGAPGAGNKPSFGSFSKPAQSADVQKADKSDWEGTLIQSIAACKGRGTIPGGLERFVDEMLHPKVPWTDLLRNFLREQAHDDFDFMQPNRLFDESEFILPSMESESMGAVVFAIDTSGSIDRELLKQFKGEEQGCLDDLRPAKVVEICCDSKIQAEREYRQGERIELGAPGGGGTSFVPVFDRLAEMATPPKCVVYLTDLEGDFPAKAPDFPVIWVVYGYGEKQAPFGEVIKAD